MITNKQLNNYYKRLSSVLPSKLQRKIFPDLRANINFYLSEHPSTSYEDFLLHFGTPEEIASSYMESLDKEDYEKQFCKKLSTRKIIILLIIIIVLAILGLYIFNYFYAESITPYYYTDIIEEGKML